MAVFIQVLIFAHLMGLVLALGSGVALWVARRVSEGLLEGPLARVAGVLRINAHVGLALLWVSGPLVVWLRYGGFGSLGPWFWIKMIAVIILSAGVGMSAANVRRIKAGEAGAGARAALLSRVTVISGVFAVLAAVFAFG